MSKILGYDRLASWRNGEEPRRKTWVVTNGCFDLLHVGHVRYLQKARDLGDALLVGINDDAGVRELKGPERPLNPASERAEVLAALECVNAVCIFPGARAVEFLQRARPDIYAKGGDYTVASLYAPERSVLEAAGARIEILALVEGKSTSNLFQQMTRT